MEEFKNTHPVFTTPENPIEIVFDEEKFIKTIPAINVNTNAMNIIQIVDLPLEKQIIAHTFNQFGPIVLWEGDDYDKIVDWTNEDVIDRVKELFTEPAQ